MKILALNSSPRTGGQSKTELMLTPLVEGMRNAGASVEVVELRKKTVNYCIGCFTCWTKTPGKCIHKDDMTMELFDKWLAADLVVYATPLYHFTINAELKAFIERTLPVLQPFFKERNGRTHHPKRHEPPKVVMLSVAGFPEASIFSRLSSWLNYIYGSGGNVVAEIYRPNAEAMTMPYFKERADEILNATRLAGTELIEKGEIHAETMERIIQPVTEDIDTFRKIGNLMWETCIRESITPKEFSAKGYIPRADSIDTFLMILPMGFSPKHADGISSTIQFNFSGAIEGTCYFRIAENCIEGQEGVADNPDLTIDAPFEVWLDIMTGKADGQQMFMEQKYTATGDLSVLMRMNQLFGGR